MRDDVRGVGGVVWGVGAVAEPEGGEGYALSLEIPLCSIY